MISGLDLSGLNYDDRQITEDEKKQIQRLYRQISYVKIKPYDKKLFDDIYKIINKPQHKDQQKQIYQFGRKLIKIREIFHVNDTFLYDLLHKYKREHSYK